MDYEKLEQMLEKAQEDDLEIEVIREVGKYDNDIQGYAILCATGGVLVWEDYNDTHIMLDTPENRKEQAEQWDAIIAEGEAYKEEQNKYQ